MIFKMVEKMYAPKSPAMNSFAGNPALYIPDDLYISDRDLNRRRDPTRNGPATYPSHSGVQHLLDTYLDLNHLTKYQLGKVLGCKSDSQVWQWFNGYRRPSALYLSRMLHVQMLAVGSDALPLEFIRAIDWETSEITWRTGLTTKDDHYWPGFNADKKNRGKRVPHLIGGLQFTRGRNTIPEQRVSPSNTDTSS
jgi:hypothetical protein